MLLHRIILLHSYILLHGKMLASASSTGTSEGSPEAAMPRRRRQSRRASICCCRESAFQLDIAMLSCCWAMSRLSLSTVWRNLQESTHVTLTEASVCTNRTSHDIHMAYDLLWMAVPIYITIYMATQWHLLTKWPRNITWEP